MRILKKIVGDYNGQLSYEKLADAFKVAPALSSKAVRLYPQFSLTNLTEGLGYIYATDKAKEENINGYYAEWKLIGEPNMLCNFVAGGSTGTDLGVNNSSFYVCLDEQFFNSEEVGKLENGKLIYFEDNGTMLTSGVFRYRVKLLTNSPSDSVSDIWTSAGRKIQYMYPATSEFNDRGYFKMRYSEELHREYVTMFRSQVSISGTANMTKYILMDDISKERFIMDEYEKQLLQKVAYDKENILIYGKSTVNEDGVVHLTNPNTKQKLYTGNGLENQISSSSRVSYTSLSKQLLKDIIGEVEYRAGKAEDGVNILLVTGSRGKRIFMDLMEDSLKVGDSVYATRSGNNITLGGNFTKFIYGNSTITVSVSQLLDYKNQADELDEYGYPLSSSKMFFIDRGTYDGQPNISVFYQSGLKLIINDIIGVGGKDGKSSGVVSSPIHGSSKIALGTIGLKLLNPDSCMLLERSII